MSNTPKPQANTLEDIRDIIFDKVILGVESGQAHFVDTDEAEQAIQALITQATREARIDELHTALDVASETLTNGRAMAETTDDGELIYGVEETYFRVRIKELEQSKVNKAFGYCYTIRYSNE